MFLIVDVLNNNKKLSWQTSKKKKNGNFVQIMLLFSSKAKNSLYLEVRQHTFLFFHQLQNLSFFFCYSGACKVQHKKSVCVIYFLSTNFSNAFYFSGRDTQMETKFRIKLIVPAPICMFKRKQLSSLSVQTNLFCNWTKAVRMK